MTGYVYVLRDTQGHNKIGFGRKLDRADHVSPASPYPVELALTYRHPSPRKIEGALHRALGRHRLNGEWFACDVEDVLKAIPIAADEVAGKGRPTKPRINCQIDQVNVTKLREFISKHGPYRAARIAGFPQENSGILRHFESEEWNPTLNTMRMVHAAMIREQSSDGEAA